MPYTPHTPRDEKAMLEVIGVPSIDDLFCEIPDNLKLSGELNIPSALDENKLYQKMFGLASQNISAAKVDWYLGAGLYDRYIPASVSAIISRGEFLTAYTPYQPELSQGYLQTIYEFQSMIAELYQMDVANASMYDASTAMAEAAIMATGINGRTKVAVSNGVHPNFREVLETYSWAQDIEIHKLELDGTTTAGYDSLGDDVAAIIVQYPNFLGTIEDLATVRQEADRIGAQMIVVADPVAMALLPGPGSFGADIVVGEGQPMGVAMGFGGPLVGLFAVKEEHVRRIPGRIVGRTHDVEGKPGYVMTLRTREQDIRREKATSNICTNEALMALASTVYMSALGKNGMRSIAESSVKNTQYAMSLLKKKGFQVLNEGKVFCEFVLQLSGDASTVRDRLLEKNILAGLPLGTCYPGRENQLLMAFTENRTKAQIERLVDEIQAVSVNKG